MASGASGSLFRARRSRKYAGERRWASAAAVSTPSATKKGSGEWRCRLWAVITSIYPPTRTVRQIAALPNWCLVVVGDRKSPAHYNVSAGVVFLDASVQETLGFATASLLPWDHFGRKNLGFLYTTAHTQTTVHYVPTPCTLPRSVPVHSRAVVRVWHAGTPSPTARASSTTRTTTTSCRRSASRSLAPGW